MLKVLINRNGKNIHLPLQDYLNEYHQQAPKGWFVYIEEWVNKGMNIKDVEEYEKYLKKMNLRWFDYEKVNTLYQNLKKSKYNEMFEDDILRYIAHIYGLGYFKRTNYDLDINNPDLDNLFNKKFVFRSPSDRSQLRNDEMYSIMDLLPLKNGMNGIRRELLFTNKW